LLVYKADTNLPFAVVFLTSPPPPLPGRKVLAGIEPEEGEAQIDFLNDGKQNQGCA